MFIGGKKWHYVALKSLSALLRGITPNHVEDFYCLNCFHSYRRKDSKNMKKYVMMMNIVM